MKKLVLFFILLLSQHILKAQFETVINTKFQGYKSFLRTLGGDYAMIINGNTATILNEKGELFETLSSEAPVGGYNEVMDLSDTSLVFSIGAFSYEPFCGWCGIIFTSKLDKNWEWSQFYGSYFAGATTEKSIDGGYTTYEKNGSTVYKYDSLGYDKWSLSINGNSISDVAIDIELRTICALNGGLWVIDSSGQSDTLFTNFDFTHIETISFGNLVGSKSDTIYLFDENFQVIQKAPILGETVKDMKSMEDRVAVLTESNHVYLYDQDLMLIANFQLDYDHLTFKNIVPDEDGIVLAGDHHYGVFPSGNNAVFVKKFGTDGFDPYERRDIGLYFVQQATKTDVWPEAGKFKVSFQDVKFQVFNYSDTVLNSFRANVRFPDLPMEWPLQPNPVPQHFFKQFSNLNLAPGQNMTLSWDEFTATFVEYPSGNNMELCFWSSMPDGKSDINPNNDVACADFFVNDEEQQPEQIGFEVFPNPTTSSCSIIYSLPAVSDSELSIYDAMGRLLHRQQLAEGTNRLVIDDLTKGMNLLVLKVNGNVVKTEKLIRD